MIKTIDALRLNGQRVLMRVDFNVPLKDGKVDDNFRIQAALPSIKYCIEQNASVVLMSHLGRPGGQRLDELSLIPVGEVVSDLLEKPIKFTDDCISQQSINVSRNLMPGEIHLLENVRFHAGETKNDRGLSRKLSDHGTVYVNDAFGTAHRAHASNVGVADRFREKGMGFLMSKEYRFLYSSMKKPQRPLVVVLGGAKIETKMALIHRFLREADGIIIGGGMAFTFLRAMNYSVGKSLVQDKLVGMAAEIISRAEHHSVQLHFPTDFVVADDFSSGKNLGERKRGDISLDEVALDIGSESIAHFTRVIDQGATVIWNGPMGVFEKPEFLEGTLRVGKAMAKVKGRGGLSIIGGGDTAAAVRKIGLSDEMSHISTGGGACLKLLAGRELPALRALEV